MDLFSGIFYFLFLKLKHKNLTSSGTSTEHQTVSEYTQIGDQDLVQVEDIQ